MTFDYTITIGNLLSILTIAGSIGISSYKIIGRIKQIELKVDMMWHTFKLVRENNVNNRERM